MFKILVLLTIVAGTAVVSKPDDSALNVLLKQKVIGGNKQNWDKFSDFIWAGCESSGDCDAYIRDVLQGDTRDVVVAKIATLRPGRIRLSGVEGYQCVGAFKTWWCSEM